MTDKIKIAKDEAGLIARILELVRGPEDTHEKVNLSNIEVHGSTVVYRRNNQTFHLVVFTHDEPGS